MARRWLVGISAALLLAGGLAARRPYYGGTLRLEIRAFIRTLDPKDPASDAMELGAKAFLGPLVVPRSASEEPPFKIARWESGKSALLVANEECTAGRPYLDAIEITMGRDLKDQAVDFSLGKADITETGERKGRLVNTLAIIFNNDRIPSAVREALSLSIDRKTIQKVLLKDQGEPAVALLPQWLSGYAFLFDKERDVSRARQLAATPQMITFAYDRQDTGIRRIAERITVNAMEAGVTLRPINGGNGDARLELLPITANDELLSLETLANLLKLPFQRGATPYDAERAMMEGLRVIPVLHLADAWTIGPRVHNWPDLANVWIDPEERRDLPH